MATYGLSGTVDAQFVHQVDDTITCLLTLLLKRCSRCRVLR